jgi:hypothetical protein
MRYLWHENGNLKKNALKEQSHKKVYKFLTWYGSFSLN